MIRNLCQNEEKTLFPKRSVVKKEHSRPCIIATKIAGKEKENSKLKNIF